MDEHGTTIRKVETEDLEMLQRLSTQTFLDAFGSVNTKEDMQQYLSENFDSAKLKSELENPLSEFYFAINETEVAAYLKLNTGNAQTELHAAAMEIERIYVLRNFQSKKIGQQLLDFAISRARRKQVEFLWLGVWEKNEGAIRFYQRNGFTAFGKHSFFLGRDKQTDIIMKYSIRNSADR